MKTQNSHSKRHYLERKSRPASKRLFGVATGLGLMLGAHAHAATSVSVTDPADDLGDPSGNIRNVQAEVKGDFMVLSMSVEGIVGPSLEETAEGMVNRYYYHWLIDTDNNPATGRSNAEYETVPTGVVNPVGAERVVMVGWRDGKQNGVEVYDPLDEDNAIVSNFPFLTSGNKVTAYVPLAALGVVPGQTIAVSAFQEGASEDWRVDWAESGIMDVTGPALNVAVVEDPVDDLGDSNGDIRQLGAYAIGDQLFLWMTVEGIPGPAILETAEGMVNRYHWHWLLDTDNNPATGRSNAEYETNPTGVVNPIGAERVIMVAWRDGKPAGLEVYDPLDDDTALLSGFNYQVGGNMITAMIPLETLGIVRGQTVAISGFQEGASEDWSVDWAESDELIVDGPNPPVALVLDPAADLPDPSGDIRRITAHVEGENLHLSMTVEGLAAPSMENTVEGKVNRYYYHWLLDTDNNPATGRSNAEYETVPTGVVNPVGAERVVMVGWRDGKPNGAEVYDPLDEDNPILVNFPFHASGNTVTAVLPLSALGLIPGQTIALSGFQEGASDDWMVDWAESSELLLDAGVSSGAPVASVDDPQDIGDANGDIKRIEATLDSGDLVLRMSAYGTILPTVEQTAEGKVNRHYYHWLIDTDNNPATGRSNAEYETNPTGVVNPIGAELVVAVGWRDGALESTEVYNALDEDLIISEFDVPVVNGMLEVRIPLSEVGLLPGQTVAISGFQEGASDDWTVDWLESAELTLSEGTLPTLSVEAVFTGDAYGFEIVLTDDGANVVDEGTVEVTLDNAQVTAQATKNNGVTRIVGTHSALLAANSIHTVGLSVEVAGEVQSRNFVFEVAPYTVLPSAGRLATVDTANDGFVAYMTMIGSFQSGFPSVHSNIAELAEIQLNGEMVIEGTDTPYSNETDYWLTNEWKGPPIIWTDPINWYELAPESTAINFQNDQPIPHLEGLFIEGMVAEILTYLELSPGNHKIGIYTEGGHKVTAGLSPDGPVLSLFDNSGEVERVPSYFARNQFFDVVAPEQGYYPIRILWFQSRRGQEPGVLLELFTVKDRELHLVNDPTDPLSIKAYRAGVLLTPGTELPTVTLSRDGSGLTIEWTGQLEASDTVDGEYSVIGQETESPMTLQTSGNARFFRARQ